MARTTPGGKIRKFGHFGEITNFLWSVADLLRGDYKQALHVEGTAFGSISSRNNGWHKR